MCRYSVIIPTYNRKSFLKKAVSSVLDQSLTDFELIIVDDGSTDGTKDFISTYNDSRIRYFYQQNKGVSSARNKGIIQSRGDYIAFLDSDDWWVKNKLMEVDKAINKNPEYKIFHTREKWYRNGEVLNQKKKHRKPGGNIFKRCLKLCCVSISTAVVKKDIFKTIGMFDENLPACEDYDFWLRASLGYPVYLIKKVLTEKEGGHKGQQSKKYWGMDRFRIMALEKLLNEHLDKNTYNLVYKEFKRKCNIYANGCFKRGKQGEGNKYIELISNYSPENYNQEEICQKEK
ncbi:MAG: glycosyltransferase family 2 protein [Elusimicrobiota bacterium]